MITKDRLLSGLYELINVEEGMVTMYANFTKALLKHTLGIENEKKEKIERSLSSLYRGSAKHKEIVDSMIQEVTESKTDEY